MYTGLTGKVTVGGNKIAYISNWSIEDTADIIEITELGNKFKKRLSGLQSWSASADGSVSFVNDYEKIDEVFTKSSQKALFSAKHGGDKVEVMVYLNDGTNKKDRIYFKGKGFIESLSVDLSAEDKGNISISINGSGELLLYIEEYDSSVQGNFKPAALLVGDAANLG